MRSSIIPILGLPLGLLFSNLPSSTSFNNPSPLTTCPIQFLFCLIIVSTILLLSTTASSTSSLLILSSQLTFSNLLQTHISKPSSLSIASFFMTQVSHPYSATCHTSALTILFSKLRPYPLIIPLSIISIPSTIPLTLPLSFLLP